MTKLSLVQALKQALQDDNKVSKYEARVIHTMITSSGHLTGRDREALKDALENDNFDDEAYQLLHGLLMKEQLR